MNNENYEQMASYWDDKLPNLASALRNNKKLQAAISDIETFDGWIRCVTDLPKDNELVLVTDGKEVWMGDYNSKRSERDGKWSVVYDGAPPFISTEIVAWMFMPHIPEFPTN